MSTGGERGRRRTTEPAAHGRPGGRLLTRPCTADGSDGHHVRVVGSVACRCIAGHHLGKPEHDRIDKPMHLLQLGTQRSGLAAQPVGEPVGLGRPRSGHRRFRSAPRGYRSPCPVGQRKIRACARPSRPPSRRRSRLEQRASWSPHAREATNEIPNRASHEMGDRFRHRGPTASRDPAGNLFSNRTVTCEIWRAFSSAFIPQSQRSPGHHISPSPWPLWAGHPGQRILNADRDRRVRAATGPTPGLRPQARNHLVRKDFGWPLESRHESGSIKVPDAR